MSKNKIIKVYEVKGYLLYPSVCFHTERKLWQIEYRYISEQGFQNTFHRAYNLSFWEDKTLEEVIEKVDIYFETTKSNNFYEFKIK